MTANWTKETPTKTGIYFAIWQGRVCVVSVNFFNDKNKTGIAYFLGDHHGYDIKKPEFTGWAEFSLPPLP